MDCDSPYPNFDACIEEFEEVGRISRTLICNTTCGELRTDCKGPVDRGPFECMCLNGSKLGHTFQSRNCEMSEREVFDNCG